MIPAVAQHPEASFEDPPSQILTCKVVEVERAPKVSVLRPKAILPPAADGGTLGDERAYSLTTERTHALVSELLVEYPAEGEGRFGCYRIPGTSRYSDVPRSLECTVFQEFFGNGPRDMVEAYGPYEESSTFMLIVDREEKMPAGTLRIIESWQHGIKTLNDIELAPLRVPRARAMALHGIESLQNCWDVGTLAVLKKHRGRGSDHWVGTTLYGLLHAAARDARIDHLTAILDRHAYVQLTEMLSIPFVPIAGTPAFEYMGADNSRAAHLYLPDVIPTVEAFMARLHGDVLQLLRPFLTRVIYAEGIPPVVEVR